MNALAELHLLNLFLAFDTYFIDKKVINEFEQLHNESEGQIFATLNKWCYKFFILEYGVSMRGCWLNTGDIDYCEKLYRVFSSIAQRLEIIDYDERI